MKNTIWAVLAVLVSSLTAVADNKISMVTYFPTPYMAYQDVTVAGPCDIGLINQCKLSVIKELQAGSVEVLPGKTLTLKGNNVTADKLISGEGSNARGSLVFNAGLTVKKLPVLVQSLEAPQGMLRGLKLGTKAFPACNNNESHEISWKKLTINGEEGVYLVCGNGTETEATGDDCESNPHQEKCCTAECYAWDATKNQCRLAWQIEAENNPNTVVQVGKFYENMGSPSLANNCGRGWTCLTREDSIGSPQYWADWLDGKDASRSVQGITVSSYMTKDQIIECLHWTDESLPAANNYRWGLPEDCGGYAGTHRCPCGGNYYYGDLAGGYRATMYVVLDNNPDRTETRTASSYCIATKYTCALYVDEGCTTKAIETNLRF